MIFRSGVSKWKWDPRERGFSHKKYFGSPNVLLLPFEGLKKTLRPIEDQQATLRCGPYSAAVSNGYLRRVRFHPDWQAKPIAKKQGRHVDHAGSDPRAIMDSLRDVGSIPWDSSDIHLATSGVEQSGNYPYYPDTLTEDAGANRITAYLGCDDKYDFFDDIRWALYRAYNPETGQGPVVHAFSMWYDEWTVATNGIVPTTYKTKSGLHTYLFVDWCLIGGVQYLIAHNSYGTQYGDYGVFYFPREVVNREFAKWGTALKIPTGVLTPEMIQLAKEESTAGYIQRTILKIWYVLSEKFGSTPDAVVDLPAILRQLLAIQETIAALIRMYTKPSRIHDWATATQKHEGYFAPGENPLHPNGTRSWRNNNPGNIKYGPYAKTFLGAYGQDDKGFSRFHTYNDGFNALCEYLTDAASWQLLPYKQYASRNHLFHDNFTIEHFYDVYAPASDDNDPDRYAAVVARALGVPTTTPIKDLL